MLAGCDLYDTALAHMVVRWDRYDLYDLYGLYGLYGLPYDLYGMCDLYDPYDLYDLYDLHDLYGLYDAAPERRIRDTEKNKHGARSTERTDRRRVRQQRDEARPGVDRDCALSRLQKAPYPTRIPTIMVSHGGHTTL